jgi:hypothetical protein
MKHYTILCKLQKGCTRLAAARDKVYQLLAHGRRFSPGTPASSTTKTGRHDIAEILLKVALKHQPEALKSLYRSTLIEPKLCINHWKILYKLCVFYVDRNSKMTTTA